MKNSLPSTLHGKPLTGRSRQEQDGMTLVEILVGMGLMLFITAAVIALQSLISQSEDFTVRTIFTTENANTATQEMIADIRAARPADNGAYPLVEAADQQVILYANTDTDTDTERVRFFLYGTELMKGIIDPAGFPVTYPASEEVVTTVAENIRNASEPMFYYYNQNWPSDTSGNPLSTPADLDQVKLIRVFVRVNADPSEPQSEFVLESSAQIRSLKENL